jgi:hypothetical protein
VPRNDESANRREITLSDWFIIIVSIAALVLVGLWTLMFLAVIFDMIDGTKSFFENIKNIIKKDKNK